MAKFDIKTMKHKLVNAVFSVLGLAIIAYIVFKLKGFSSGLDFSSISFDFRYLTASFMLIPVWFILMCHAWRLMVKSLGFRLSLLDSMRIVGLSMFGKYIPGKLWFTLGRAVLAERLGVSKKATFTSVILETYLLLLTGGAFFLFLLFTLPSKPSYYLILSVIAIFLLFPLSIPEIFKRMINFFLKILKKNSIEISMSLGFVFKIILLYMIVWICLGIQFYLLYISFSPEPLNPFVGISIYPAAWIVGFAVIIMPAGLGFREGVMFFFLSQNVSTNTAAIMTILSRIQITLGELLYLFLLFGSHKLWRNNEEKAEL